ncbi:MAG: hypothetical protein WAP35_10485 [Solirubrobacterales bacterium]
MTYAPANTNSVRKGGVARGVVPIDGMSLRLMGFTGYCDVNAYTKKKKNGQSATLDQVGGASRHPCSGCHH